MVEFIQHYYLLFWTTATLVFTSYLVVIGIKVSVAHDVGGGLRALQISSLVEMLGPHLLVNIVLRKLRNDANVATATLARERKIRQSVSVCSTSPSTSSKRQPSAKGFAAPVQGKIGFDFVASPRKLSINTWVAVQEFSVDDSNKNLSKNYK